MATTTSSHPDDASSMSDDVFEDAETTKARIEELRRRPFGDGCYNPPAAPVSQHQYHHHHHHPNTNHNNSNSQQSLTSSHHYHDESIMAPVQRSATGYPGYRPSREALQMYAYGNADYALADDYDDGWRSYRYDEVDMPQAPQQLQPFDDTINHKTILLGDSGVGKTSFLVKYNTGEFRLGSFSATVGIALTPTGIELGNFAYLPFKHERNLFAISRKMRRQQTRYRSDSIGGAGLAGTTRKPSLVTTVSDASPTRRESLVKPTWQHITPGQLPPKTLDKINGIASDDSDDDGYPKRRPSVIVHQRQQSTSQQPLLPDYMSPTQFYRDLRQHQTASPALTQAQVQAQTQQQSPPQQSAGNGFSSRFLNSMRISTAVEQQPLLDTGEGGGGGGGGVEGVEATAAVNVLVAAPAHSQEGAGSTLCKSAGRALIRMISSATPGHEDEEDFDIMGKVIMLGDSGVGKTSLLIRFRDGRYVPSYFLSTVGIDFRNKVVVVDGTRVKLQIWDTAGQERFRSVTHAYYRDAHALLLLYDVTNKTTYDNIRAWLGEIREYAQEDVVIVLIGNKADCGSSERQVKREDGERLGREHNVPFMETSAKTGLNVELAFTAVARQLKSRGYDHGDDGKFNVHDFVRDNTKARSVCAQCRNM